MDRNYNDDYSLVKRSNSKAMIGSSNEMIKRIKNFIKSGYILSINNKKLILNFATGFSVHPFFCVCADRELVSFGRTDRAA